MLNNNIVVLFGCLAEKGEGGRNRLKTIDGRPGLYGPEPLARLPDVGSYIKYRSKRSSAHAPVDVHLQVRSYGQR